MKKVCAIILIAALLAIVVMPGSISSAAVEKDSSENYVVGAYVTQWNWSGLPDPFAVTHIYWCFGTVNTDTHRVELSYSNQMYLWELVALKEVNPDLKVLLSVGGASADGFSQAARSEEGRIAFAESCKELVDEFGLDGIDIDWENPVNGGWGTIEAIPEDFDNFPLLCDELRAQLGDDKLITIADGVTNENASWFDYKNLDRTVDYYNMMGYCFTVGYPGHAHEGNLYPSQYAAWGGVSADMGVKMHLAQGVPAEKIVLGTNFYVSDYTNGIPPQNPFYSKVAEYLKTGRYKDNWDSVAKASYLTKDGDFILTYESPRAIAEKADYVKEKGLGGMMYWEYGQDDMRGTLRNAVWNSLNGEIPLCVYIDGQPSKVIPGQAMNMRMQAIGGAGEYEYRYMILQNGRILCIQPGYTEDPAIDYTPYRSGEVNVIVFARDASGAKASVTISL